MASYYETFWTHDRHALVGHSADKPFPKLTYRYLKERGATVFPVDPSMAEIEGDRAYDSLEALPETVEAVIIELPKAQAAEWVGKAADAGVKDVWLHQGADTPEALEIAKKRGLELRSGSCAVMYVTKGFAQGHGVHRALWKMLGKY